MKRIALAICLLFCAGCGDNTPVKLVEVKIINATPAHVTGSGWGTTWWADIWILQRTDTQERVVIQNNMGNEGDVFKLSEKQWISMGGMK